MINERDSVRLRHILETKPASGRQPSPMMFGDDSVKREQKSLEARKEIEQAYQDHIVRTPVTSLLFLAQCPNQPKCGIVLQFCVRLFDCS